MKRQNAALALVLCAVMALSLFAGLAPAAAAEGSTLAERQQQVVAVALAYFDKGHSVQYDGKTINTDVKRQDYGKTRSTYRATPEDATPHETAYTVCSDFAHEVYWEAFHYELLGNGGSVWTGTLSNVARDNPMVVWYFDAYDKDTNPTVTDQDAIDAVEYMFTIAQPGDIFTSFSVPGQGGHTMIWAGDLFGDGVQRIIHSGGKHMNVDAQMDVREYYSEDDPDVDPRCGASFGATTNGGSIRIANAEEYIRERYMKKTRRMTLLRPAVLMTDEEYPVRAASQYRVTHPRLAIDRTLNKTRFQSAYPGETVTLTLKLSNFSSHGAPGESTDTETGDDGEEDAETTVLALPQEQSRRATVFAGKTPAKATLQALGQDYTVPVTEVVPKGAKLLTPFAGATVTGDTMTLDVPLAAGETKTFTATYEITATTGEEVVFGGSSVGDIPSNSIPIQVGGRKLTEEDRAKLLSVADGAYDAALAAAGVNNDTLADFVYRNVLGLDVTIPTFTQIAGKFTKTTKTPNDKTTRVFLQKDEVAAEDLAAYRTMVPTCWGGMSMWNRFGRQRCSDPRDLHLEPGDVIVRSDYPNSPGAGKCEQLVYLGGGKYLSCDKELGTYPIVEEPEFFRCLFYKIFYVLRPTLSDPEIYPAPAMEQSMSLNLNDTIVINYYLSDAEQNFTPNSFALVDGERAELVREGTEWYLPVRESAAKEMSRQSTLQLVATDADGVNHYSVPHAVSIRSYAETVIGMTDWSYFKSAKLGRAMIAMLDYGTEAQKYFGYETGDPANKNITQTDHARMTIFTPEKLGEYRVNGRTVNDAEGLYYASSCVLGSNQALRFYLHLPESRTDRETLTFRVHYRNYNGVEKTQTKSLSELVCATESGDYYYFEVPGMAAADVQTDVTLTVEKAGETLATVTDSIAGYCARVYQSNAETRELVDAVLVYGLSARDYFFEPVMIREENEMPAN